MSPSWEPGGGDVELSGLLTHLRSREHGWMPCPRRPSVSFRLA
jgi:hypothetical protein